MSRAFRFPRHSKHQEATHDNHISCDDIGDDIEKDMEIEDHDSTMSLPFLVGSTCGLGGEVNSTSRLLGRL